MNRGEVPIDKVPFGYKIEEVDKHLKSLQFNHNERLREMNNKILNYKLENVRLKEIITKLQKEKCSRAEANELIEYALTKTDQFISIINSAAEKKIEELEREYLIQLTILDRKIEAAEKEIKAIEEQLDLILKKEREKGV